MHPDAEKLLAEYPNITVVEALITDCNGAARGKWLPIEKLSSLLTEGMKLPKSAIAQDAWGRDVPSVALDNGDIDGWCQAIPGSLKPVLGSRGVDQAQLVLTMFSWNTIRLSSMSMVRFGHGAQITVGAVIVV